MYVRLLLLLLASSASMGACSDTPVAGGGIALPSLHAEPDPVGGGRIRDAAGREVLLRGVNVNAYVEYWSGNEFPTVFPLTEADAQRMAEIGWSAVRLLLSWSRVEPEAGVYDDAYLAEIGDAIALLARHGLYTIVDLHQDAWGATLAARPDEVCEPPSTRAIGWDGAPAWATFDLGRPRCIFGARETSAAVAASWDAFLTNREGPGGIGIRTRYARMLGYVAGRFANEPAVAGYDLINEPAAFSTAQQEGLAALYAEALAEIRAGERAAGGPSHLVFFEPTILWSGSGGGPPLDFARDDDIVYAPHLYTGGFDGLPITRAPFEVAVEEAAGFGGAPVLCGEWGTGPDRAGPGGDGYFLDHQAFQDEYRISATLWTWRESCGDPHKVADERNGSDLPVPWGEFDVDCRTNEILGERADLVRDLVRAYPRAAPGRLVSTRYDPVSGALDVVGADADAGVELVVFYPVGKHGDPVLSADGLTELRAEPGPGGAVYLRANALGGDWSLRAR